MLALQAARKSLIPLALSAALTISAIACGRGGAILNEPEPSGDIVAQGSFTSLNGRSVTGTATVYRQATGAYVLRLGGVSTPEEIGLSIILTYNGSLSSTTPLRSYTGSQNYSLSLPSATEFNRVTIRSTSANLDYGQALLIRTGTP
jgi:hypothetical protein